MVQYFSVQSFASSSPVHGLLVIYCDPYAAAYHWRARDPTIPNNFIFWPFRTNKIPQNCPKMADFYAKMTDYH